MPTDNPIVFPATVNPLPPATLLNDIAARDRETAPVQEAIAPTAVPLGTSPAPYTNAVVDAIGAQKQQALDNAITAGTATLWDATKAAARDTDTAYLASAFTADVEPLFNQIDPEYDALADYSPALARHGLADTPENMEVLATSGSRAETDALAEKLKAHERDQLILSEHGVIAFLAPTLDPAQLVAAWATFGGSKALQMGRIGSAALQTGASLGVSRVADELGAQYTALDYTLNAAMMGSLGLLVGGPTPKMGEVPKIGSLPVSGELTAILSEFDKLAANPESAGLLGHLMDDPARRGGTVNKSGVSYNRILQNIADGDQKGLEDAVTKLVSTKYKVGTFGQVWDFTGKNAAARQDIQSQVAKELLRRDADMMKFGQVSPSRVDPDIAKLADQFEQASNNAALRAKEAGLLGFEDFTPRPGYFHRAWNPATMRRVNDQHGVDFTRELLTKSLVQGSGMDEATAKTIATAITTRAASRDANLRADFLGSLGRNDTDGIKEMLVQGGVDEATIKSVMGRIDSHLQETGKVKYGKNRLPMDMTVTLKAPDGSIVAAHDLIDTDLLRITQNYLQSMSGRTALQSSLKPLGYGGDDASLQRFRQALHDAYRGVKTTAKDEANLEGMVTQAENSMPTSTQPADEIMLGIEKAANEMEVPEFLEYLADPRNSGDEVSSLLAIRLKTAVQQLLDLGHTVTIRAIKGGETIPAGAGNEFLKPGVAGLHGTRIKGNGKADSVVLLRGSGSAGRMGINATTALHELTHAVTINTMRAAMHKGARLHPNTVTAVKQLHGMWEKLSEHLKANPTHPLAVKASTSNIMKDPLEMVAWAMSSPEAQGLLAGIRLPKGTTALGAFVSAVKKMFGLTGKKWDDDSVLAYVMERSDIVMEGQASPASFVNTRWADGPDMGADWASTGKVRAEEDVADAVRAGMTDDQIADRMQQFEHLLGDFTGMRPESAKLGSLASQARSFAQSTMLASSGLWQVAELGTIAWHHGMIKTTVELLKFAPGFKGLLKNVGSDPKLYEELTNVTGLDFTRDMRVRPWLNQWEANLSAEGGERLNRVLHLGQQATPILNGMKYVHKLEVRMAANMNMNMLVKAAHGDAAALKDIARFGLTGQEWENVRLQILDKVDLSPNGNAKAMNWDAWEKSASESALATVSRMIDFDVLHGRPGEGSSFQRSAVGQVLGQFRGFVGYAHNKQLRATIANEGYVGLGVLMAYQFPMTFMMVAANEASKGRDVDFSEAGITKLVAKAVGYTAALGYIGDAAGIVGLTGGRGGVGSVPAMGILNAPAYAMNGTKNMFTGEYQEGLSDYMQVARTALPFVNVIPGVAALNEALKE